MSEWMRDSRAACDRFAPTLALLDDPASSASSALDPTERAAALEHLAGCALCQADQAADARLDTALRRAFNPQVAAPLRTRDLLLAIGATHEPTPHITVTPARGAANPIRSVVNLGDFADDIQGGSDRMSESDEAHEANGAATQTTSEGQTGQREGQPAPAHKMAAIPSLRPAPRPRGQRGRPGSQALAMGFSATAAAVILIVVAATLFASRGRAPAHTSAAQRASATATAQARLAATTVGPIYAISFDSPTDGWALGDATPQQSGSVQAVAALYHYDGRQWTLKQRVSGYPVGFGSSSSALRMFSPTDGWAFGGANNVLRYDGTMWRQERISLPGGAQIDNVFASDITSPTEGWAVAYISPASGGDNALGFLRFDGSQWTVEQQGIKLPSDLDPQSLQVTNLAALPGGDVWATGSANVKVTSSVATATANAGNNPDTRGFLIHRAHGVWTVDGAVSLPANAVSSQFNGITMTSPTSGWVVGQVTVSKTSIGGGERGVQQPLLLRFDGERWTAQQTPQDLSASNGLSSVMASGPANVWVLVPTSGGDINANGQRVSALFLHYDGATWTEVQGIFPGLATTSSVGDILISAVALGPDGTLWCMGSLLRSVQNHQGTFDPLIFSYRDGAWSKAAIATK